MAKQKKKSGTPTTANRSRQQNAKAFHSHSIPHHIGKSTRRKKILRTYCVAVCAATALCALCGAADSSEPGQAQEEPTPGVVVFSDGYSACKEPIQFFYAKNKQMAESPKFVIEINHHRFFMAQ